MATPAAVLSILVKTQGAQAAAAQLGGLDKSGRAAAGGLGKAESQAKRSSKSLSMVGTAAKSAGVLLGAAGLAKGIGTAVSEYREAQKVGGQTTAVLKSTGGAANVTAKHIQSLAGSISKKSGIDDEAIQSSENMLLTFTKVRNETGKGNKIFDQATQTVTDMSVALGQSGKSSAIQLGKALNDPVKGITALRRVGVSFTADQQKQITTLENTGHHLEAQKIILRELKTEFAGSAAAQATAGDKFKVAIGNLAEAAGAVLVPAMDKVLPVLTKFFEQMVTGTGVGGALISKFKEFGGALAPLGQSIGTIVGWLQKHEGVSKILAVGIGVLTAAVVALNIAMSLNPFVAAGIAIAALVVGVVAAYQHFQTFRNVVNAVAGFFVSIWPTVSAAAITAFNAIKTAITAVIGAFQSMIGWVRNAMNAVTTEVAKWHLAAAVVNAAVTVIKTYVSVGFAIISNIVKVQMAIVSAAFRVAWDVVKAIFRGAITVLSGIVKGAGQVFSGAVKVIEGILRGDFGRIWDGIKTMFRGGITAIKGILTGAAQALGGAAAAVGDALAKPFETAANLVIDFVNAIIKAINKLPFIPDIGLVGHVGGGGGGGGGGGAAGGQAAGKGKAQAALAKGGAFGLTGGTVNAPMVMMGEEAPRYPEFVIPTNPAYRKRAQGLLAQAAGSVGMAGGGVVGLAGGGAVEASKHRGKATSLLGSLSAGSLPGWMSGLGSGLLAKAGAYIKDKLASAAKSVIPGGGGAVPGGAGGVGVFDGKPVADWIVKILQWAREHGWTGQVTSGFRTYAEQARIYNSGVRPAARPGTSNHEGSKFPRGAVDVSDGGALAAVLAGGPYAKTLIYAGAKDPVHYSHPHGGSYARGGVIRAFAQGGINSEQQWLNDSWAKVAPLFGQNAGATPLPSLFKHIRFSGSSPFVGVATTPGKGNETAELLWPRWLWANSKDQKKLDPRTKLQLFIHEMAHRFQSAAQTEAEWLSEGGAEAFARISMSRRFGGAIRNGSDPYNAFVTKVMKEKGVGWVTSGQFANATAGAGVPGHGPARSGINVAIAAARKAGFKGTDLVNMVAIAGRESGYSPTAHNYDPPRDDSWGLWQINVLPNANPRFKSWNLRDPYVNARAARSLFSSSGLRPWNHKGGPLGGTNVPAARAAVLASQKGGTGGAGGGATGGGTGGSAASGAASTAAKVNPFDQKMANADLAIQQANNMPATFKVGTRRLSSSLAKISALQSKRKLIGARIRSIRKALKGKVSPAKRLALTQELTSRLGEHAQLATDIAALRAPAAAVGGDGGSIGDVGGGGGGFGGDGGDPNQALIDSNAALQASIDAQAQADREHTAAVTALRDEINKQNAIASSTIGIGLREAQRALADIISGQLGGYGGAAGRALTASSGSVVRY